MDVAAIVLEYLKVILSTPVVLGVIAIVALLLFKSDIKTLIGRIATIKLPGGSELSTLQQSRSTEEATPQNPPNVSDEQLQIPNNLQLSQEQLEAVRKLYVNERANAYLWEYRYLNFYFVPTTQFVLEWIATTQQPTSLSLFDNVWGPLIQSVDERQAIIDALQSHHLIQLTNSLVEITPKGQEYLEWRGPMPRTAT